MTRRSPPWRRRGPRGAAAISCAVALLISGLASAGELECPAVPADKAGAERLARILFDDAVGRETSDPEGALARLVCAQKAADRPAIALRIGNIHERMGRLAEAADMFERYLRLAGQDAPDAAEMREHIEKLREGVRRQRHAEAPRRIPTSEPLLTSPAASERPLVPPLVAFAFAGVGAALAVTGTVLLFDADAKDDSVHALEGQPPWNSDAAGPTHDAAWTEQTVGIGVLIAGGLLTAAGLVVGLTGEPSVSVRSNGSGFTARSVLRF